jgi:hypothetical protein
MSGISHDWPANSRNDASRHFPISFCSARMTIFTRPQSPQKLRPPGMLLDLTHHVRVKVERYIEATVRSAEYKPSPGERRLSFSPSMKMTGLLVYSYGGILGVVNQISERVFRLSG